MNTTIEEIFSPEDLKINRLVIEATKVGVDWSNRRPSACKADALKNKN
jgi:hypothetical protein